MTPKSMNADSFLLLMVVMLVAMALTLILFSCLWASAHAPVNRRKRRLELGRLLQCSHPEWN